MIDAVILAAGYGTRLERDITEDKSGKFTHLKGLPKPLIPVGGKPLIEYWITHFNNSKQHISNIYIVTNTCYYSMFKEWATSIGFPIQNLLNDGSTSNDKRLGAVADVGFVIQKKKLKNHLLVIAGDTLFLSDFKLDNFINTFLNHYSNENLISHYLLKEHKEVSKRGIIELNATNQVINFLEKPSPSQTTSNSAVPPLYLYSSSTLSLFSEFLEHATTLSEKDAPGLFVAWLYSRRKVFATRVEGRFDIGGLDDYESANSYYSRLNNNDKHSHSHGNSNVSEKMNYCNGNLS